MSDKMLPREWRNKCRERVTEGACLAKTVLVILLDHADLADQEIARLQERNKELEDMLARYSEALLESLQSGCYTEKGKAVLRAVHKELKELLDG